MINIFKPIELMCAFGLIFNLFCSTGFAEEESSDVPDFNVPEGDPEQAFMFEMDCIAVSDRNKNWDAFKKSYPAIVPLHLSNKITSSPLILGKCYKSLKENNFNDFAPKDRMIVMYLYNIWEKLLEANQDILSKYYARSRLYRSIIPHIYYNDDALNVTSPYITKYSSIYINIAESWLVDSVAFGGTFNYETHIAANLSRQLAHIILDHERQVEHLAGKLGLGDSQIIDTELGLEFIDFDKEEVEKHPQILELRRKQVLEADELGFELFLNAGYDANYYAMEFFVLPSDKEIKEKRKDGSYNEYIKEPEEDGEVKLVDESSWIMPFAEDTFFIDSMKDAVLRGAVIYENPTDIYPIDMWRYFYIDSKIKSSHDKRILNNKIKTRFYIKVDLSKLEKLDEIKKFFSQEDVSNIDLDYTNTNDPRVYIVNEVLSDNSKLDYTFEQNIPNRDILGLIQEDNTIMFEGDTFFKVASILLIKDLKIREFIVGADKSKDIDNLYPIVANFQTLQAPPCVALFTQDILSDKLKGELNESMKKLFIIQPK